MTLHRSLFAGMLFTLAACATATTESAEVTEEKIDPRRGEEVKRVCFSNSISGFGETTKTSVVMSKGTRQYLVTTRNRCSDLDDALSLATQTFDGCLSRGDKLIGFDSPFGPDNIGVSPIPCYVDKIYEWDRKAVADTQFDEEGAEATESEA